MVSFFRFLSGRRQSRAERKFERNPESSAAGAYSFHGIPDPEPSQLLQDVLVDDPPAAPASSRLGEHEKRKPLSQRLNVGARLAEAKKKVVEAALKLASTVDAETARAMATLADDLECRVCRIAFIGQMNAGKSSLINVLVEQAELLPADINPWTTVITNLHFGVPGAPPSGASFNFFSLEEWRRLSIGGRTRELTERIFPNFDWDALNRQVEIMQRRAEKRLGPRLEPLLGARHDYPAITPGLLNRYVGAGIPEVASQTNEGEFSDITKLANVFFDLGPFNFPTVLTDTPGVNDPFLVRDEITRQSLEAADICVIVVTARQPLSTADLGLLRLLRGLNRSRVIIFVNKMDEITPGDDTQRELTRRIAAVLTQEFPGAKIPIVFGSAIWARDALFTANSDTNTPFIDSSGLPDSGASYDWLAHDGIANVLTSDGLLLESGLPSLAVAISEMMESGAVAEAIADGNRLIVATCRNWIAYLEAAIALLSAGFDHPQSVEPRLGGLKRLEESVSAEFQAFEGELAKLCEAQAAALGQKLTDTVKSTGAAMLAALSQPAAPAQLAEIDLKMRLRLESIALSTFDDAAKSVFAERDKMYGALYRLYESTGLALDLPLDHKLSFSSSYKPAALGEPAAVGVVAGFTETAQGVQREELNNRLLQSIVSDFEPITTKLAEEASRALSYLSQELAMQTRMLTLRPLRQTIEDLRESLNGLRVEGIALEEERQKLNRMLQTRRDKISKLKGIFTALEAPSSGPAG